MKIQLPERGQPLDTDYLYQMAVSINSLNDRLASSKTLSSIYNGTSQQSLTTNQIRFYSTTKNLNKANVAANTAESIDVAFDTGFTNPPVVTATILNNDTSSSAVGTNAIVNIISTTTLSAKFNIFFLKAGKVNVNLHIIAIGT